MRLCYLTVLNSLGGLLHYASSSIIDSEFAPHNLEEPVEYISLPSYYEDAFAIGAPQINMQDTSEDPVSLATREYWMRRARSALLELTGSPCPFEAFGSVIVNHTGRAVDELGDLICIGANSIESVGNPTLHGEIATINNCTNVLAGPPYNLTAAEILSAWRKLTLYTTAEACAMCAAAIGWGRFAEYVYATDLDTLIDLGWSQIPVSSTSLLRQSPLAKNIRIVDRVLADEMNELFAWQWKKDGNCPEGCARENEGSRRCVPMSRRRDWWNARLSHLFRLTLGRDW